MELNEQVRRVASITGNPTLQLQEWYNEADAGQQAEFETLSKTSPQAAWAALACIHDAYAKKAAIDGEPSHPIEAISPSPIDRIDFPEQT
jgi:hypothetical protein